jgi:hypothetical protein
VVFKRATQHALDDFSAAVKSKDRTKVAGSLKKLLPDSANIHLEISFLSITGVNPAQAMAQEFDRTSFITFIDNTLYSLNDYSYTADLQHFTLRPDRKTAEVVFTSKEWADGISYYAGGGVNTHFSSTTTCEGHVVFEEKRVMLDKAVCKMQLRSIPKPGEDHKLPNQ